MADEEALDRIKTAIEKLPRAFNKTFTPQQLEKRRMYRRAYENWSEKELKLLKEAAALNLGMPELSRLFGRQPSVLEDRLNGHTGPRLNGYSRL